MREALLARLPYIAVGLLVWAGFYIAGRVVNGAFRIAGDRTRLDPILARLLGRLAALALSVLGLLIGAVVVFPTFRPGDLVAGLGITSIALGFAFKDILQNWLAGVFILWRRPFQIGDEIRTRDQEGKVEAINVRATVIRTYDGERLIVPNADVYTNPVLVKTACESRRVRMTVGVGYLDAIDEARAVLRRVLQETEGVLREPEPWVHVLELAPSDVRFALYFWVRPEQANVLAVTDRVTTGVKKALDGVGIDIPYPHTVVLFHDVGGTRPGDRERKRGDDLEGSPRKKLPSPRGRKVGDEGKQNRLATSPIRSGDPN
jgi:small-conductance mechanosensitive channel